MVKDFDFDSKIDSTSAKFRFEIDARYACRSLCVLSTPGRPVL